MENRTTSSWAGRAAEVEADARPGRYYVTARDERGRTAFLLGPFVQPTWGKQAHLRALSQMRRARRYATEQFRDATWATFGTSWVPLTGAAPVGKLNTILGGGH